MYNYFNHINTAHLDEKLNTEKFPFSRNLFWDAEPGKVDLKTNSRYVIERVLLRGSLEDFYMLLRLYSREEISAAVLRSRELDPKTADFCSYYFHIPKSALHVSSFYH
ncbi:MAG TPA: hypothetical protein PKC39_15365 [Ferruginibacter sp.]|nr:hypothetical protein [Ferruginibacter sp.]HMP22337.1 hypothetical protein [Ferruginibacter sp.]